MRQDTPAWVQAELARMVNDAYAELGAQHPERFKGFASIPISDPDARTFRRMVFAEAVNLDLDAQGRILVPPMMRMKGKLEDLALFLGTGETFQIWNPELLLKDDRIPEDLKDIARFRLNERGAAR